MKLCQLCFIFFVFILIVICGVIITQENSSSLFRIENFYLKEEITNNKTNETICVCESERILMNISEKINKSEHKAFDQLNLNNDTSNLDLMNLNENISSVILMATNIAKNQENISKNLVYSSDDLLKLPEITEYLKSRNESREAIFYTETSANGKIKARFVCALESAARVNPNSDIYLLVLTTPPYQLNLTENVAIDWVRKYHPNIQILACDLKVLFNNTFVQEFYTKDILKSSQYKATHTSDLIRLFVLWKYGGKYFDLDVVLIRAMSDIKNFVVEEYDSRISLCNGLLALEKNSSVALTMLNYFIKNFSGTSWDANGPQLVTKVMTDLCGTGVANMTTQACKGFTIIRYRQFFPLVYSQGPLAYFEEDKFNETKTIIDQSKVSGLYGFHIGNNASKDAKVTVFSKQPYSLIAQKYCPRSYWSCHTFF